MVANMTNEKQRLHHSRFPDSAGPLDFVLPGNVNSSLLRNIIYRYRASEITARARLHMFNVCC